MALLMLALCGSVQFVHVIATFTAYKVYKPPKAQEENDIDHGSRETVLTTTTDVYKPMADVGEAVTML